MANRFMRHLQNGWHASVQLAGVNYPATSVDVLKPSKGELASLHIPPLRTAVVAHYLYFHARPFFASINQGIANAVKQVKSLHARCPQQQFVMMGYSQGAIVVSQAGDRLQDVRVDDPAADYPQAVGATLLLADPDRGQPGTDPFMEHRGSAGWRGKGIRAYLHASPPGPESNYTMSVCDAHDIICDFSLWRMRKDRTRNHDVEVHKNYLTRRRGLLDGAVDRMWTFEFQCIPCEMKRQTGRRTAMLRADAP